MNRVYLLTFEILKYNLIRKELIKSLLYYIFSLKCSNQLSFEIKGKDLVNGKLQNSTYLLKHWDFERYLNSHPARKLAILIN